MKNKMKFVSLFMMLFVAVSAFAQQVDKNIMKKARNTIENMCQTVQLDAATKQKALDLTYARGVAYSDRSARMEANKITKKEYDAIGKKISNDYWKELQALIPENQLDSFLAWKNKPKEERGSGKKK